MAALRIAGGRGRSNWAEGGTGGIKTRLRAKLAPVLPGPGDEQGEATVAVIDGLLRKSGTLRALGKAHYAPCSPSLTLSKQSTCISSQPGRHLPRHFNLRSLRCGSHQKTANFHQETKA